MTSILPFLAAQDSRYCARQLPQGSLLFEVRQYDQARTAQFLQDAEGHAEEALQLSHIKPVHYPLIPAKDFE
jgi:hypothetical protein